MRAKALFAKGLFGLVLAGALTGVWGVSSALALEIESASVVEVVTSTAVLKGVVNPGGVATAYRFEYTSDADFQANGFANATKIPVPDEAIGSGTAGVAVSQAIGGLAPGSKYDFRLVASDGAGSVGSPAKSFTTFALPEAPRQGVYPGQGFLPDGRAWELVSPPGDVKDGADVMANTTRTRVAAAESPGLPMAATFASLSGFGDAPGSSLPVEYLAQRDAVPGTSGWSTHAITPRQEPLSIRADIQQMRPEYPGYMSEDLTKAVFRAWSPLGSQPNVQNVVNLYTREDLRVPGEGSYTLLTDSTALQPPVTYQSQTPTYGGASTDFKHVAYESSLDLTSEASGTNMKVYEADEGTPRLISNGSSGCSTASGGESTRPCAILGTGIKEGDATERIISADGSRVNFTSASRLYQFERGATFSTADDTVVQINTPENGSWSGGNSARYETASADGSRVFFLSRDRLYMWERKKTDETQRVSVDAEGGTFTLTARTQPSAGTGELTLNSNEVQSLNGSFTVGQTISGTGIAPGTTIADARGKKLILSQPATATGSEVSLEASVQATTAPLPYNATAAQVQSALAALRFPDDPSLRIYGEGNVSVTGGPGGAGAATPYEVVFTGALAGVDVMQMTADGSTLTGAGHTVTVATTVPVRNLTLIAEGPEVLGASEDGHRVYFYAPFQLIPGGPRLNGQGLYYWQDADGTPGGTLSFVGELAASDGLLNSLSNKIFEKTSRLTPDGKYLLFETTNGSGLAPRYEHGACLHTPVKTSNGRCAELYLYKAESSTQLNPDVVCVSCDSRVPEASVPIEATAEEGNALLSVFEGVGGSGPIWEYSNRAISADGRYVFFSTPIPLVLQDTNGRFDAYEYDTVTNTVHLLSSGVSPDDSYFLNASADGSDVFFVTRQRLSGWDTDNSYDLYDARVGGGLPEPVAAPPSCQGDACQPAPLVLNDPTPASFSFAGPGTPGSEAKVKEKSKPRALTRAQRLAAALRACSHKPRKQRGSCRARAQKRYGTSGANRAGNKGRAGR